jgi:hypothetical protein
MGAVSVDVGETAMFPFWLRQHEIIVRGLLCHLTRTETF